MLYICVSLSELIFIIYAWEADSACEPSLAYLVLDAAETFVIGSRTKRGIKKVMNTNIKSIRNCVIVKRVEKVKQVRGFNQSAWKHLLPVLLILLLTGMSWSTTAAQTRAYVTNFFSDTVSVINTTNNTLVTTIPVGSHPIAVATTPDAARVYVANQNSANVSVINTATNAVIATVAVGIGPSGVAITPNGTRAYVTNQGSDTVSIINTATNTVVTTVPVGVAPFAVVISPNGTRAYVTNRLSNSVTVINTADNTIITTIAVGVDPFAVATSPDGTRAYVANTYSNTVSVIDTSNNTVIATITVGSAPIAIAVADTPNNGTRVYVVNQSSHNVTVINAATNAVITTVAVGFYPSGVAITSDGASAYVTNQGSGTVSEIDTTTNAVTGTVSTNGVCPFGIAIPPDPLVPTAAPVTVGGRVMWDLGKGIFRARLNLTDDEGNTRTTFTNPFGYYRFEGVEVGKTYILTVSSKNHQFAPQILTINEEIVNLNFTMR